MSVSKYQAKFNTIARFKFHVGRGPRGLRVVIYRYDFSDWKTSLLCERKLITKFCLSGMLIAYTILRCLGQFLCICAVIYGH